MREPPPFQYSSILNVIEAPSCTTSPTKTAFAFRRFQFTDRISQVQGYAALTINVRIAAQQMMRVPRRMGSLGLPDPAQYIPAFRPLPGLLDPSRGQMQMEIDRIVAST
jgi:hypothetical protein